MATQIRSSEIRKSFGAIAITLQNLGLSNQTIIEIIFSHIIAFARNLHPTSHCAKEQVTILASLIKEVLDTGAEIEDLEQIDFDDFESEEIQRKREEELIGEAPILEINFEDSFPDVFRHIVDGGVIYLEDVSEREEYIEFNNLHEGKPDVSDVIEGLSFIYQYLKRFNFDLSDDGEGEEQIHYLCLRIIVDRLVYYGKISIGVDGDLTLVNRHILELFRRGATLQ